jgi:hypothetical protein
MTPQAQESKHITPEMCAVLRYTAEHGCMAKIGEPWLEPARLLERQGLIVLWRCLAGHYAARLTPAGAEWKVGFSIQWRHPFYFLGRS